MAKRAKTKSFTADFPIKVNQHAGNVLENKFKAANNLYNSILTLALGRARRMRSDTGWKAAGKMPKTTPEEKKARNEAYNVLTTKYGFSQFALEAAAEEMRDSSWLGHHLQSHDTQAMSKRAYEAVAQWVYGNKGYPHHKPLAELHSIEGKTNKAVIRFREDRILWDGLDMPLLMDSKDKDHWQEQALACKTKYVRILKGTGKHKYSAQLVQEGLPPERNLPLATAGTCCPDMGPQTANLMLPTMAAILTLAPKVANKEAKIAQLNRDMDRSQRATNPNNYKPNGQAKRGCKWVKSRHYKLMQAELNKIQGKLAAEVDRSHGEIVNQIRAQAKHMKVEKANYSAWQKRYGKSIGRRSPGAFIAKCKQKFENTGGTFTEFKTQTTKLSQYDHTTDDYKKKPLSLRVHNFRDGKTAPVHRDLYSAFLGLYVENDLLDASQVRSAWTGAEPLLRQPVSSLPTIHKLKFSQEGSPVETRQSGLAAEDQSMRRPAPVAPTAGKTADPTGKSVPAVLAGGKPSESESPCL
jgi:hypothetical protein